MTKDVLLYPEYILEKVIAYIWAISYQLENYYKPISMILIPKIENQYRL